jgi:transposase
MQENKENPNELLELLLEKCDRLYQENMLLKGKLEDRTDVDALKSSYEKTLSEKDNRIVGLEKQVAYLRRRIWGKSSERYIQADPQQRRIDFDGLDLLPGEIELAEAAREEIETFRERRVKERVKRKPVRKPLPEDLPRIEEHLYPAEISDNKDAWTELEPEITEVVTSKFTMYKKWQC